MTIEKYVLVKNGEKVGESMQQAPVNALQDFYGRSLITFEVRIAMVSVCNYTAYQARIGKDTWEIKKGV